MMPMDGIAKMILPAVMHGPWVRGGSGIVRVVVACGGNKSSQPLRRNCPAILTWTYLQCIPRRTIRKISPCKNGPTSASNIASRSLNII